MNYYNKIREERNKQFPPVIDKGCEIILRKDYTEDVPIQNLQSYVYGTNIIFHQCDEEFYTDHQYELIEKEYDNFTNRDDLILLGKPVSLNDVLMMTPWNVKCIRKSYQSKDEKIMVIDDIYIDLTKSIEEQSEDTLEAIYNLIK